MVRGNLDLRTPRTPQKANLSKDRLWKHFGSPLAAFWVSLGLFWLPVAIFRPLLVRFGSLLLTAGLYFLIFGVSQRHFYILLYFPCKSYRRQGCSCNFLSKYKFLCTRTRKTAAAYRMRCLARWRERGFAALKIIFCIYRQLLPYVYRCG